jgi:hypothetical protein
MSSATLYSPTAGPDTDSWKDRPHGSALAHDPGDTAHVLILSADEDEALENAAFYSGHPPQVILADAVRSYLVDVARHSFRELYSEGLRREGLVGPA